MISPELLRRHTFFGGLSAAELEQLATAGRERTLAAGEMLFTEGARADHFYFLAEGEIETLLKTDGEDLSLSSIPPGGAGGVVRPHRAARLHRLGARDAALGRDRVPPPHAGRPPRGRPLRGRLMKRLAELISRRLRDTQVQLLGLTARQHT